MDTPEIEFMIVESNEPMGPYGAKEAGEGPLHPAIANAIFDAVSAHRYFADHARQSAGPVR